VAPIPVRAAKLVEILGALPGERFNLIAHSMGGLDARYAITRLGLAGRVASLVTIGAPHRGTPLAEFPLARVTARALHLVALGDLTPAAVARFNREVPDVEGVAYGTTGSSRRCRSAGAASCERWRRTTGRRSAGR
jgi:triacylglycerol lipase